MTLINAKHILIIAHVLRIQLALSHLLRNQRVQVSMQREIYALIVQQVQIEYGQRLITVKPRITTIQIAMLIPCVNLPFMNNHQLFLMYAHIYHLLIQSNKKLIFVKSFQDLLGNKTVLDIPIVLLI